MSSDSESNSLANLLSSSDEDIMEEDVEEIQGQITPYEDEPLADSEADAGYEREIAAKLTHDTKGKLHAVSSWLV